MSIKEGFSRVRFGEQSDKKSHGQYQNREHSSDTVNSIPFKYLVTWFTPLIANKEGFEVFCRTCDRAFEFIAETEYFTLLHYVRAQAEGIGCNFWGVPCNNWKFVRIAIAEFLGIRETQSSLWEEIIALKRSDDELLYSFYNRLVEKSLRYAKLVRGSTRDQSEIRVKIAQVNDHIRDLFVRSLDSPFNVVLASMNLRTIEEAFKIQRDLEIKLKVDNRKKHSKSDEVVNVTRELKTLTFGDPVIKGNEVAQVICQYCYRPGHTARKCWDLKRILKNRYQINGL